MQTSVPDLMDVRSEEKHIQRCMAAGTCDVHNNCLLARRLIERGVRFVQLYDKDRDHHGDLPQNPGKRRRRRICHGGLIRDSITHLLDDCSDLRRRIWPDGVHARAY
jgi:hypothetical protein